MKKLFIYGSFFIITPLLLISAGFWSYQHRSINSSYTLKNPGAGLVLSYETNTPESDTDLYSFSTLVKTEDARPLLIKSYLEKYQSPLISYADFIFQTSLKYSLDYGLIVAIAQCESNICKKIPEGSYNCWGFGNGESRFSSYESAIEYVAKTLKEDYYDQGLVTPDQIMPKYVPPSVEKGGPWAKCVNQYLEELR